MNEAEDRENEKEDIGLEAFHTGLVAFAAVQNEWENLRIDRRLGRGDVVSQENADRIAQRFARGLERYLSGRPQGYGFALAGEVFRGIFYAWISPDMNWDPSRLGPMNYFED